jgi:ABC-type transport system involved in multi-copper enzyme maturation permease subunit
VGIERRHPPGLGLGPVFGFEWLIASRRRQVYATRSLFVSMLLAALVVTWWGRPDLGGPTTTRALADFGEGFYVAVVGTQLTLVLLAAPAATAGAICLDRSRGALTHLLVTDLSAGEIVLGKLAARLLPVLGLVGCALPVLALLTLLGGVDPDALFGATLVTIGVALLGCSLALAFSLRAGRTHEALLGTYVAWGLWLLGPTMITGLDAATGWSIPQPPRTIDPFYLALAPYWWPGLVGWGDFVAFLGGAAALSAALAGLAVFRLRPVCTRERTRIARRGPTVLGRRMPALATRLARASRGLAPSLDSNPVLWREWHRNRPSRLARIVVALYIALAATFSAIAIGSASGWASAFVNAMQVSIGLLLLSVTSATALAEERARGSLDVLLATPLSTRQIVVGKWLGSYRRIPPLAILPALVILGGVGWDARRIAGAALMVAYVLGCGAAVTSLGLALATWCPWVGRAVGLTVAAYVLATVGWMFLVMATMRPEPYGVPVISGSPFYGSIAITVDSCEPRSGGHHLGAIVVWVLAFAGTAAALLVATLASFNRCLGRVETGGSRAPAPSVQAGRTGPELGV